MSAPPPTATRRSIKSYIQRLREGGQVLLPLSPKFFTANAISGRILSLSLDWELRLREDFRDGDRGGEQLSNDLESLPTLGPNWNR